MVHLFVDGDYFLSGMRPTCEEAVRSAVDDMLNAIATQLFAMTNTTVSVEHRVVFFSSSIMKALDEHQQQREVLITALRRLRFQTTVLDSIPSRAGSPVDAAMCTKTMSVLSKSHAALNMNSGGSNANGGGRPMTFVYFAANAYISSALELARDAGCGVCFVVYDGDSVADELMAYVSPMYGNGAGIATVTRGEGVGFIPNTGAASAALAALQHEGKELPLAVLMQLKQLQKRLTGVEGERKKEDETKQHAMNTASVLLTDSSFASPPRVPPPIAGAPDPFAPDDCSHADHDDSAKRGGTESRETAILPGSAEALGADQPSTVTVGAVKATDHEKKAMHDVAVATTPADGTLNTTPPLTQAPVATCDGKPNSTSLDAFPEPEVYTRLPVGWALMYDRQRRRHYFVHTGPNNAVETTWTHPGGIEQQMDLERQVNNWHQRQREPRHAGASAEVPTRTTTIDAVAVNWDEYVDTKSGRKYYVNRYTKQTSWTRPSADTGVKSVAGSGNISGGEATIVSSSTVPDRSALPPFWEERVDPKSGRTFYVNHQTRETTWTRPQLTVATQPQMAAVTPAVASQPLASALPPFWEERVDPKSGRTFYVNHQTRETTWARP